MAVVFPGVSVMVDNILGDSESELSPSELVDRTLGEVGLDDGITDTTRDALVDFATRLDSDTNIRSQNNGCPRERAVNILKLVGTTPEFQRV